MVLTFLSIALIAVIGVGSTLAYYSASAGDKTNVFTFSENIRAELSEPNWDADEGLKLTPGKQIKKDPMVTNTCDISEYVALRLTFQYKDKTTQMSQADLDKLLSLIVIDWNVGAGSNQWTIQSGSGTAQITYLYNQVLASGEVSSPVMNSFRVKTKTDGLTEEQLYWLQGVKLENGVFVEDAAALGGFNIKVEGAAIQATDISSADAVSKLVAMFS